MICTISKNSNTFYLGVLISICFCSLRDGWRPNNLLLQCQACWWRRFTYRWKILEGVVLFKAWSFLLSSSILSNDGIVFFFYEVFRKWSECYWSGCCFHFELILLYLDCHFELSWSKFVQRLKQESPFEIWNLFPFLNLITKTKTVIKLTNI